jgi:hypothetical protein
VSGSLSNDPIASRTPHVEPLAQDPGLQKYALYAESERLFSPYLVTPLPRKLPTIRVYFGP